MIAVINLCKDFHSVNMMTYKEELTNFIFEKYITSLPQNEDLEFEELDIPELVKSPTNIISQSKNITSLIDENLNQRTNDSTNQSGDCTFEIENNLESQPQNEIINIPNERYSLSFQQDNSIYQEHYDENTESNYYEDNYFDQTSYNEQLNQETFSHDNQQCEPPPLPPKPKRLQKEEHPIQESTNVNSLQEKETQESFYTLETNEKITDQTHIISQEELQSITLSSPCVEDKQTYYNVPSDSCEKQNEINQQHLCDQIPQQEDSEPYKEYTVSQIPEEKYQEELIERSQDNDPISEHVNQSKVENNTDKINQEQVTISVLGDELQEIENNTNNVTNEQQRYDHFIEQENEDEIQIVRQVSRRPTRSSKNRKPATKKLFEQLKEMKIEAIKEELKDNEELKEELKDSEVKDTTQEESNKKEISSLESNQIDSKLAEEENQNNKEPKSTDQQNECQVEEKTIKTSNDQLTKNQIDKKHSNVNQMLLEDLQKTLHTTKKENKPSINSTNCTNENTTNQSFLPILQIKLKKTSPIEKQELPIQEEETEFQKIMKKRREQSN
ncbi:hypothetical protein CL6EHI_174190 [Entamoeba histolytica]|nr:hypothetical protein CL6EHI_174190 [Entamoeba histolytica]